jgi:hypothetical protein
VVDSHGAAGGRFVVGAAAAPARAGAGGTTVPIAAAVLHELRVRLQCVAPIVACLYLNPR